MAAELEIACPWCKTRYIVGSRSDDAISTRRRTRVNQEGAY
jgi:phage FluMu protein Com